MEEKSNRKQEEDQNTMIKVSEFERREVGAESAFEIFYMKKEVYLGYEEDLKVKLIRDRQSGEPKKVVIFNKFHYNVFKLNQDKSRLEFQFRSRFSYPKVKANDKDLDYIQDDGNGVLFWFFHDKLTFVGQPSRACYLLQVDLEKSKSKKKPRALVLQKKWINNTSRFRELGEIDGWRIYPLTLPSNFIASNTFYFTQINENSMRVILKDGFRKFEVRIVTRTPNSNGQYYQTILKLFGIKFLQNHGIRENKLIFNRFLDYGDVNQFYGWGSLNPIYFQKIWNKHQPHLVFTIIPIKPYLFLSLIDLRFRRILKTTSLDLESSLKKVDQNDKEAYVLKYFYSYRSDQLVTIFVPKAYTNKSDDLSDCFILQIEGIFCKRTLKLGKKDISDYQSFLIEESHCRILLKTEVVDEEDYSIFTLIDYSEEKTKTTRFVLQFGEPPLLLADLREPILKFTKLDENKVLLFDRHKMYIVNTLRQTVLERKRYCHLHLDKRQRNFLIQENLLLLVDKLGLTFEVFKIKLGYELEYFGEYRTGLQMDREQFKFDEGIHLKLFKMKNGRILISFGSHLPQLNYFWNLHRLFLFQIDLEQKKVIKNLKIEPADHAINGFDFDLSENSDILFAQFSSSKVYVQIFNLNLVDQTKINLMKFEEAPYCCESRFRRHLSFVRKKLIFMNTKSGKTRSGQQDSKVTIFGVKRGKDSTNLEFERSDYELREGKIECTLQNTRSEAENALIEQELNFLSWSHEYDLNGRDGIPKAAINKISGVVLDGNRHFTKGGSGSPKTFYQNGTVMRIYNGGSPFILDPMGFSSIDFRRRIYKEISFDLKIQLLNWKHTDKSEILVSLEGFGTRRGDQWEPNRFWLMDLR